MKINILIFVAFWMQNFATLDTSGLHGFNNQLPDIRNRRKAGKCMRNSSEKYIQIAKTLAHSANLENVIPKPQYGDEMAFSSSVEDNISLFMSGFKTNSSVILTNGVSDQCLSHTEAMLYGIAQGQNWAMQMNDASGKLPANILRGNFMWLGDYDECVSVKANAILRNVTYSLKGEYCYVTVPVHSPSLCSVDVSFSVGLCLPDSCKETDVLNILNSVLSVASNGTLSGNVITCQEPNNPLDTRAIIVLIVLSLFIIIMIVGTAYDVILIQRAKWKKENDKTPLLDTNKTEYSAGILGKLILCFSVYSNGAQILSTKKPEGSITSINGIRFLSMNWVIMAHTMINIIKTSDNVLVYTDFMSTLSAAAACASVSVDTFFTLSGTLVTYLALKNLKENDGKTNWAKFYIHRFWRLTPPYMLVLMVYVSLFPYTGSGPFWQTDGNEPHCKDTWFYNILYINNLIQYDQTCFGISWYLANDMQFYVISPVFILLLYHRHKAGVCLILVCSLGSWIITGVYTAIYNVPLAYFSADKGNIAHYAFVYYLPFCRIGPYLVGIYTGYLLYRTKCEYKIKNWVNICGWIISTVVGVGVAFGLHFEFTGNGMSRAVLPIYTAINRSLWGACVSWVIFSCANNYGGFVNTILSWSTFIPLSRLTYMTYLVHPIIVYHYHLTRRRMTAFTYTELVYEYLGHLILGYMAAFLVSLAFEVPMMALEKVILKKKAKKENMKDLASESNDNGTELRRASHEYLK